MPLSTLDQLLITAEQGLRTLGSAHRAKRPTPVAPASINDLDSLEPSDQQLSGALMRVNHVGEVCAQALYQAQALSTRDAALKAQFEHAAQEEVDHLAWTADRLKQLGARPSLLNPLWYLGAFTMGLVAGRLGDRASLGFVIETERQVEEHLHDHLGRLPAKDLASRAIVSQMKDDEARHALDAERAGGAPPPWPVPWLMRAAAKVMTTTAHHI